MALLEQKNVADVNNVSTGTEIPSNVTIYINNLNEKIKIDELKKSLHAVFSQFGKILEILAFKTLKHKGQAWVVFEDVKSATNAMRQMQSFPFYDKPMRIQYAKAKSDIIAKADGTFVPREKRKKHEEKGKKKKEQHDANQVGMGLLLVMLVPMVQLLRYEKKKIWLSLIRFADESCACTMILTLSLLQLSQIPYPGGAKSMVPEVPAPPNNILFIQNLPSETTPMMLQMLFQQYPGFKEVRMVETKPGIAFIEYGDDMQSTGAMHGLQGFKIQQNSMLITYAKK
ncbi:hypothetical protein GH714_023392 [Hevea brasiliensis]|uniref:RRM domain-containing protein n=1 Tax=Hevea brasiliensis TaxID=3981 RepID=A0A6A6LAA8_HEVBR|nr:hypothetical protein GH714_023392 [Hevea brasiliensis]